jgi:PAS domain S-box-containing protein
MTALRSDGTEFPVDLTVTRLGTEGAPLFTGFVRDITGRKRAEAAVGRILSQLRASANAQRESEQLLRTVIRDVPLIVFALDRNGVFTLSEGRGLESLGLRGGEVVGRSVFEVYRDFPDLLHNVRRALAGEITAWTTELAGMTFDTRCTLISEMANEEPTGLIAVAFDVTKQKRAEHVARGQTQALTRALDALATRPEFDRFVEQVLAAVAEQLQSPSAALSFCDQNDSVSSESVALRLVYDRGQVFSPYDIGADLSSAPLLRLSREPELWDDLVRTRRPLVVRNVAQDPRVRDANQLLSQNVHSLLLVPLLASDSVVGCLSIHGDEPREFRPEEQALARALAQQAVLAVELTRLSEHEQEAAVLEERNRLAGEIHDTLAQGFMGILLQLEAAQEVLAVEPQAASAHVTRARDLARSSLVEARQSVAALRPAALERDGLFGALKRQVEQMTAGSPIMAHATLEGTPRLLASDTEHGLLRIGQEAIHNAVKYSQARQLRITLAYEPNGIRLCVRDDGQGFDVDRPVIRGSGFGLNFMRERAKQIGARLFIRSTPGQGTQITVIFPGTFLPEENDSMIEITHEPQQPDPNPDHG